MEIELSSSALRDLQAGQEFYDDQEPGIGFYFLDSLDADIVALKRHAGSHRIVHGYHRLLAKRFPYAIYYNVDGECVSIIRILDCRQSPEKSRGKLRRPSA